MFVDPEEHDCFLITLRRQQEIVSIATLATFLEEKYLHEELPIPCMSHIGPTVIIRRSKEGWKGGRGEF